MTTTKLPIPDGVLKQHVIILGKTGAGKSSVMRVLAEHLLQTRRGPVLDMLVQRLCIVDPKGDWWGIKSSANGKDGGLPVAIFGGEHAEVPITPNSGAAVAKIATEAGIPVLIDLGGWMVSERTRFFLDFAPTYFRAKGLRYLMIDEVHNFCPKGKIPDPQVGKMLHWMNTIAGEGRGRGITLIAASQRPQKVHNDVLTQCETLIAMKVSHPADMRAYRDWIEGSGEMAVGKEVMATVAGLPRGTGWVWSPEIGFGPSKVTFPRFWTYDSFAPQVDTTTPKGWHQVDIETLREQFAAEIRQAEQNDPRVLHKRIRELEQQLSAKVHVTGPSPDKVKEQLERDITAWVERENDAAKVRLNAQHRVLAPLVGQLDAVRSRLNDFCQELLRVPVPVPIVPPKLQAPRSTPLADAYDRFRSGDAALPREAHDDSSGLTTGQQKILNALAWLARAGIAEPPRAQLSAIANYRGGAFMRALGNLKTEGFVTYPSDGCVRLTPRGQEHAVAGGRPAGEMEELWMDSLQTEGQRKIFSALLKNGDGPITRDALSDLANYRGGAFTRALGTLKTMGAVEFPDKGHVALSRWVRP